MYTFIRTLLLYLGLFIFTRCTAVEQTMAVYLNFPDSSVHAFALKHDGGHKPKQGHRYYWYSNNSIISADGSFSGRLLHGTYTSYYPDHNLLQQGEFEHGLKKGLWTKWYDGGIVKERAHFSNGLLDGVYELYDAAGLLVARIHYRNGLRDGKTITYRSNQPDSIVRYRKGHLVVNREKQDSVKTGHPKNKGNKLKMRWHKSAGKDSIVNQDSAKKSPVDRVVKKQKEIKSKKQTKTDEKNKPGLYRMKKLLHCKKHKSKSV
jgi:hypothetical protein